MSTETTTAFKPKKSVALSGQSAGNTAICTVGKSGNDLHYRGYDILEFADKAEFDRMANLDGTKAAVSAKTAKIVIKKNCIV